MLFRQHRHPRQEIVMVFPQLIGVVALLPAPATWEEEIAIVTPIVSQVSHVAIIIAGEIFRPPEVIGQVLLTVVKVNPTAKKI